MILNEFIRNSLTHKTTVLSKDKIAPQVYHLKIKGELFYNLDYKIGQHIHILVTPHATGNILDVATNRNYSIWNHSRSEGTIELAICTFSNGIGATWIENLSVKDNVYITSPTGRFTLSEDFEKHVFIGDISSLAHFYFMRNHLTKINSYKGMVYDFDTSNFFADLDSTLPFDFYEQDDTILEKLEYAILEYTKGNFNNVMIYLGGNGTIGSKLRQLLRAKHQLNSEQLKFKPFWIKGKKGM